MATPLTLSDTQLILLSAGSQRDNGLLTPPARLRGAPSLVLATKLLAAGLAEEVPVSLGEPSWREDTSGARVGLKITSAGLRAIGVTDEGEIHPGDPGQGVAVDESHSSSAPRAGRSVREGSKKALVLSILQREEGASLDDLIAATGWLPHTTRAALTGLRQNGYTLHKTKGPDGKAIYRAEPQADTAGPQSLPEVV